MPLPKLVTPEFTLKVPSTKEPVKIRPFLVKEEKVLFMALEGADAAEIEDAIINVLESCVLTPGIDINKLPSYDVEYLFLQLRGKSVGENITLRMSHGDDIECKHITEVDVNVEEIEVYFDKNHKHKVQVSDEIGIKFKDPTLKDLTSINPVDNNNYDTIVSVVTNCIDVVYDNDNVYDNFNKEEAADFLNSMTQEQFMKVQGFFNTLPKLQKTVEWTCPECGQKDSVTIEGLQNFFL